MSPVWGQVGALARRSVVRTVRQPAAIVFPLVFSIGASYKRREKALEEYGVLAPVVVLVVFCPALLK